MACLDRIPENVQFYLGSSHFYVKLKSNHRGLIGTANVAYYMSILGSRSKCNTHASSGYASSLHKVVNKNPTILVAPNDC